MLRRRLLEAVAVAAAAWAAAPAAVADGGAGRVHELLRRISARQRAVRTLRASFVQVKESALLVAPVTSRGTFWYRAPDAVRWEYAEPDRMVVLLAGHELITILPGEGTVERVRLGPRQRRLLELVNGVRPLEEVAGRFSVTLRDRPGSPRIELVLEPGHGPLARRIRRVLLEIDRELLLPVAVEAERPDGSTTRIELTRIELNPPLAPGLFDPPRPGGG